jgi:hypothetical protein
VCWSVGGHGFRLDDSPDPDAGPQAWKNEQRISIHRHRYHALGAIFGGWLGENIGIRASKNNSTENIIFWFICALPDPIVALQLDRPANKLAIAVRRGRERLLGYFVE